MSTSREITVWCDATNADGQRCQEWINHGMSTVAEARRLAREDGWVKQKGKDYCPDHVWWIEIGVGVDDE